MKTKFDINNPHLKENPFTVPEGYFLNLRENISEMISSERVEESKIGFWRLVKPQLALVSTFAAIFLIAYGALTLFSPEIIKSKMSSVSANGEASLFESGFLKTSFIDFIDFEEDALNSSSDTIDSDDLVKYISENIDIITLASLE